MSIKERYEDLKLQKPKTIVLIKIGNFYSTFDTDAQILNAIFSYQVVKGKAGFPLKSLEKVIKILDEQKINFIVSDKDMIEIDQTYEENRYDAFQKEVKKNEFTKAMNKVLLDQIEYLINSDSSNYDKIKRFIDEL